MLLDQIPAHIFFFFVHVPCGLPRTGNPNWPYYACGSVSPSVEPIRDKQLKLSEKTEEAMELVLFYKQKKKKIKRFVTVIVLIFQELY